MTKKKAAALKYEQGYDVPVVTATGMGYVADRIIEKAEENSVPIVYDKELVEVLNNVDIGEDIPYELYDAVAQVIAYVMDIDEIIGRR
ncbi:EscU/YscU/HrcU family type III secretion system export apparatus switch protein [Clostridium cochlearium]|jgi:flagellar biosynthesis protein|uniref:Flagellar biogenesis protein n=1 Tax=Clostridium cochlearium TaxID=1494 RepID=A0A239Z2I9_CLOCO|nr:EscU/YscU/HrcU family type III secretion system export apparatus switch protein [Clostridium cochlearium]MBV1818762.1 EscU/YscU/HrcU family type III secretion system export apparatus switch protein [Bacteroidales bacterium MSK.15.36]NSJ91960.1 flagellar biogenesis protein [Coprococcus sp. MSK.21.13]MBE6065484.1 flagellar biogenesis protein [Clostridium cochlearium]MBU5270121.1 EscU/YscU/HrcU family type III secretion system export apparatus switch protein [Clostridium cochlearium]MCG4571516